MLDRAQLERLRVIASSAGADTTVVEAAIAECEAKLAAGGVHGTLPSEVEPRRVRSTRRRSDVAELPARTVERRTVGRVYQARARRRFRPSPFLTVTLPSYGRVHGDGTPVDPQTYDYARAERGLRRLGQRGAAAHLGGRSTRSTPMRGPQSTSAGSVRTPTFKVSSPAPRRQPADRLYLAKYLTKDIAEVHRPDSQRQRDHVARLLAVLRYQPCSRRARRLGSVTPPQPRRSTPTRTCGRTPRTGRAQPSTRCLRRLRTIRGPKAAASRKIAGQRRYDGRVGL
jgi:hypothetical protein